MPLSAATLCNFQEGQIIYLQHESLRLYAETIQIIKPRKLCWARPLALIELLGLEQNFSHPFALHDLRQGSDVLLPISLFQVALDVEAIPVITRLNAPKDEDSEAASETSSQSVPPTLQTFIRRIWQAYPEQFSN